MFKLYGRPGSGSGVCEAMMALAGVQYELIDIVKGPDGRMPAAAFEFNPLGEVPTLVLPDGAVMTESAAIAIYLADAFPAARLAPLPTDPMRPAYLRWMVFLAANVYMTDLRSFYPDRYTTDPDGAEGVWAAARARKAVEWTIFSNALGDKPFMLGDNLSAVDIYASMLISWIEPLDAFFAVHRNLQAVYGRVAAVPAIRAVWERHGVPM